MKNVADIYPLSPMQQGMLFHTLSSPNSGVYVEQLHCTLSGPFDLKGFARAWKKIIERHPTLRTAFIWEGINKPLQIVRQNVALPLTEYDWRELPTSEQDQRFTSFLQSDRSRGFEITKAPLIRLTLIRLSEHTYRFLWSYHHMVLDGWSEALLLKEVFACYEAERQGQDHNFQKADLIGTTSPGYRDKICPLPRRIGGRLCRAMRLAKCRPGKYRPGKCRQGKRRQI